MTRAWVELAAVSLFALGLTAIPQQVSALDCSAGPTDAKSEWVYRTVDGKKCWYRGTKVIPRAELRWADTEKSEVRNAQAAMVPVAFPVNFTMPASTNDERHPAALEVSHGDTFEARWQGLPR